MFRSWYATCPRGAEEALEAELQGLGAKGVRPGHGGVRFHGEREIALRGSLALRTALRVLEPIGEFKATTADELYAGAANIPWHELVARGQTVAGAGGGRCKRARRAPASTALRGKEAERRRRRRPARPRGVPPRRGSAVAGRAHRRAPRRRQVQRVSRSRGRSPLQPRLPGADGGGASPRGAGSRRGAVLRLGGQDAVARSALRLGHLGDRSGAVRVEAGA